MQKIIISIACTFLILNSIAAQSELLEAIITYKNGKKVTGVINYKERSLTPNSILFKANDESAKVIYPTDIQGFVLEKRSENYISATVELNTETLEETELNTFNSMKEAVATLELARETVFLLTLATGEINLYELIDNKGKLHFFYQKGNDPIKELIYRKVKVKMAVKDGENPYQTIAEIKGYATQLKMDVLDCPKTFSMIKEQTFYYKRYDLLRIVNNYNICKGKSTFTLSANQNKSTFYVWGGVNKVKLLPQFSLGYSLNDKLKSAINPVLGLGFDMSVGRRASPFGLAFEMLYKPIKVNLLSEENQTGYRNTKEYNFDMDFLQLNALFRYLIQLNDFQPYIKSGFGFAVLTKTNNLLTEIRGFNNAKTITTPVTQNNRLNMCLAFGVKKSKFYLEGRYDYGLDKSKVEFSKLKSNYLSLLVGYSFFSNKK